VQILETYLEFVLRPCQRVLVDHWPRPAPARMALFFTGADIGMTKYKVTDISGTAKLDLTERKANFCVNGNDCPIVTLRIVSAKWFTEANGGWI